MIILNMGQCLTIKYSCPLVMSSKLWTRQGRLRNVSIIHARIPLKPLLIAVFALLALENTALSESARTNTVWLDDIRLFRSFNLKSLNLRL
jgi:hypothetical protein